MSSFCSDLSVISSMDNQSDAGCDKPEVQSVGDRVNPSSTTAIPAAAAAPLPVARTKVPTRFVPSAQACVSEAASGLSRDMLLAHENGSSHNGEKQSRAHSSTSSAKVSGQQQSLRHPLQSAETNIKSKNNINKKLQLDDDASWNDISALIANYGAVATSTVASSAEHVSVSSSSSASELSEDPASVVLNLEREIASLAAAVANTSGPKIPNSRRDLAALRVKLYTAKQIVAAPRRSLSQPRPKRASSAPSRVTPAAVPAVNDDYEELVPVPVGEASDALPTSSFDAISSDAAKEIAKKQNLPQDEEFWVQWLSLQEKLNTSSSFLHLTESISCRGPGNIVQAVKERITMLKPGGKFKWQSAQLSMCNNFFRRVLKAHCERIGKEFNPLSRIVKIRQFSACQVVHTFSDGWSNDSYGYGLFPLLPGTMSVGNCPVLPANVPANVALDFRHFHFETVYRSATALSAAQVDKVLSARAARQFRTDLHHAGPDALRPRNDDAMDGSNIWSARTLATMPEYHALCEEALSDMARGVFVPTTKDFSNQHCRDAFMLLQTENVRGYPECDAEGKKKKFLRFLACCLIHCRRLQGSNLSQRVRAAHERQQLDVHNKILLTEINVPPPRPESSMRVTEQEFDERCVRRAFSCAKQGELGRGSATIQREQAEAVPFTQMRSDLVALHPSGDEYNATKGGDPFGANLKLPPFVQPFVYTTEHVKIDDLKRHAKNCAGAAPGPDGMTGHHLTACLASEEFCRCFQHMVVDILNNNVSSDISDLLTASIIRGIPKGLTKAAGTRPLALGGTTLKVAAHMCVKQAAAEAKVIFHGTQFGMAKGGGEYMIHTLRRFITEGRYPDGRMAGPDRAVIAIDAKNAFNMVSRTAMFRDAGKINALQGFLNVSYRRPARLIFVGHDDPEVHIMSQRGTRQGEVGGVLVFNLSQQDCINAALAVPGVQAMAYIDDTYLLVENLVAGAAGTEAYISKLQSNAGQANEAKSEIIVCNPTAVIDQKVYPRLAKFRKVDVLKALGASIGLSPALEKQHLEERMKDKFVTMIRRLRVCPSPQLFAVLRSCFLPKLGHALRTHAPEVTRDLCQMFDALITDTIRHWASMRSLSSRQIYIIQAPTQFGGLGFYSQETLAPCAYAASSDTALKGSMRVARQSTLVTALYNTMHQNRSANDPALASHLDYCSLKGADCGLSYTSATVQPDVFSALLRVATMGVSCVAPANLSSIACPGCSMMLCLADGSFAQHVIQCVRIKGGLVTLRHNAGVNTIRHLFAEAGDLPDAGEPRHLRNVSCGCGMVYPQAAFEEHKRLSGCTKGVVHTSGPDILSRDYTLPLGSIVASDFTIVSPMVVSNSGVNVDSLFQSTTRHKMEKYGQHCRDAGVSRFDTLVATPNGYLGPEIVKQIRRCCNVTLEDPRIVMTKLSAVISRMSAANLLHAETAAGICPPSLHLETLRLTKQFAQAPIDSEQHAKIAKSESLPRADGQPTPVAASFPTSGPELTKLIDKCLPEVIRGGLLTLARLVVDAAIATQKKEIEERKKAESHTETSAPTVLVADPAPITLSVPDDEMLFRRSVATEQRSNERRDSDEAEIRRLEKSVSLARINRSTQSSMTNKRFASQVAAVNVIVKPFDEAIRSKVQRSEEAVARRQQVLDLLVKENERIEKDIALDEASFRNHDEKIRVFLNRRNEITNEYEVEVTGSLGAARKLDLSIEREKSRSVSLRNSHSMSRSRIAGQSESADFQNRITGYVRSGYDRSSIIAAASPEPLRIDRGCDDDDENQQHFPPAFLGQEGRQLLIAGQQNFFNSQSAHHGYMYEEGGAVPPPQGYGNASRSRSVAPGPQRSQEQQQQQSFQCSASPAPNPNPQPPVRRLSTTSEPMPVAASRPSYGSSTPATGRAASTAPAPQIQPKQQQQQHSHTSGGDIQPEGSSSVHRPLMTSRALSLPPASPLVPNNNNANINNVSKNNNNNNRTSYSPSVDTSVRNASANAEAAQQSSDRHGVSSSQNANCMTDIRAHQQSQSRSSTPAAHSALIGRGPSSSSAQLEGIVDSPPRARARAVDREE